MFALMFNFDLVTLMHDLLGIFTIQCMQNDSHKRYKISQTRNIFKKTTL